MAATVVLVDASPRRAADGVVVPVRLAGGGAVVPYLYGGEHYRAGLAGLPKSIAALDFDGEQLGGGGVAEAMALSWSPSRNALLAEVAALFWTDAPITVRIGAEGAVMPPIATSGLVLDTAAEDGSLRIALADQTIDLKRPFLTDRYAGTGGIEGPIEWEGQIKSRAFGRCFNVPGRAIKGTIWNFADPRRPWRAFVQVRTRGVAIETLTVLDWQGSAEATFAALDALAVPAGTAVACPSIACVKWWTQPDVDLRADILGEITGGYIETAPAIAARMATSRSALTVDPGELAASIAARPGPFGWRVDTDSATTAGELSELLGGVSLSWLTASGRIVFRRWDWTPPRRVARSQAVTRRQVYKPVGTRKLGYRRNWSPMARGDLAAIVLVRDIAYDDGRAVADVIEDAGKTAEWPRIEDPAGTKPENNATVGAPVGTKVGNRPVTNLLSEVDHTLAAIDALEGIYGDTASAAASAAKASLSERAAAASERAAASAQAIAERAKGDAETASAAADTARGDAVSKARDAAASAGAASSSASTAEGYRNEAGEKATAAQGSASAASTSAGNAYVSEGRAATSERNASGSASAAAESHRLAALSEGAAGRSASAASTSASTASTKAGEAGESASAANRSEANAGTSAGSASTSASNAATSERNAVGSSSAAAESNRLAALSEGAAGRSASAAATSASTATTKAGEAGESASASSTNATNASTSAGQASSSAGAAAGSAGAAAGSAGAAAGSAGAAAGSAGAAGGSAGAAAGSAREASTSASTASTHASNASRDAANAYSYSLTSAGITEGLIGANGEVTRLKATVSENTSAIVTLNGDAAARWIVESVAGSNRAQISVFAKANGGAGVDIVGDTTFRGKLAIGLTASGPRTVITDTYTMYVTGSIMSVYGIGFGSGNQFLEWVGPVKSSLGQCTEADAIRYIRTDGGAYFGGTLNAGTIVNPKRTTSLDADAGVTTGNFGSNGRRRVVTVSYEYYNSNQIYNQCPRGVGQPSVIVDLYRGTDANGALLDSRTFNGTYECYDGYGAHEPGGQTEQLSGSFNVSDDAGGTTAAYFARIRNRNVYLGAQQQTLSLVSVEQ